MNRMRRKEIESIMDALEAVRMRVDEVNEEEADYRDNIPENLQGSERYEKADDAVSNLEEALECIENALEYLEDAME